VTSRSSPSPTSTRSSVVTSARARSSSSGPRSSAPLPRRISTPVGRSRRASSRPPLPR
jgi:hypothetical protein